LAQVVAEVPVVTVADLVVDVTSKKNDRKHLELHPFFNTFVIILYIA